MNRSYKNSERDSTAERETRTQNAVELRSQRRYDMLQKKRTMAVSKQMNTYDISQMAEKLNSKNTHEIIEGVTEFRRLLSAVTPAPIDSIVMNGLTPVFVRLSNPYNNLFCNMSLEDTCRIMLESAWVLTNIASGNTEQTESVINAGGIECMVLLLKTPNLLLQDQAVWALGNISGDSESARDLVIKAGATEPLLDHIDNLLLDPVGNVQYLRNAAWAISNLNRGRNPLPPADHMYKCFETVSKLVNIEDPSVMGDAYWALGYICDGGEPIAANVVQTGIIDKAVARLLQFSELSRSGDQELQKLKEQALTPILRAVGNIVTYDAPLTDKIIKLGAIPLLKKIYNQASENKKGPNIKKEICWIISNITAGTPPQVDAVISEGFLEILASAIKHSDNLVKIEACWAICNASLNISKNIDQCREIFRSGAISSFASFLNTNRHSPDIIISILDCLQNLLEYGKIDSLGGENQVANEIESGSLIWQIEELQAVENTSISSRAENIIRVYFNGQ
ncbi:importin subunit alpha-1/8 [Nematocida sp. AWRm80]|nr:importin subunit alpha-1/8 [Nematocida sp. AWRm80]